MIGLHPTEVDANYRDALTALKPLLDEHPFIAIGEVGLDLYWDKTFREEQISALNVQFGWAEALSLPVILHCRD